MFKLVIQDDEGKTTVVPLIRDEITIGRKEGNTNRLTERNVSRRHARIARSNGEVTIEDLGSYNGIRVNNARIAERIALRLSDQVQIGDYKLYLKSEAVEAIDDGKTMPHERIDGTVTAVTTGIGNEPTQELQAVEDPTAQFPVALPTQPPGGNLAAIADTDPAGRPVASAATVAAMNDTAAHARLVVLSSNFAGEEFELTRPQMFIGRTSDNDIVLDHRSISRNHAKVVRSENGRYTVTDSQSANGLRVNGHDYSKHELKRGDVVDLGHVRLRFVEAGEDFVLGRDAQITDVPEGGSKKGMWIAVAAAAVVLGGIGIVMAMKGGNSPATNEAPVIASDGRVDAAVQAAVGSDGSDGANGSNDIIEEIVEEVDPPTGSDGSGSAIMNGSNGANTADQMAAFTKAFVTCEELSKAAKWTAAADCAQALAKDGGPQSATATEFANQMRGEVKNQLAFDNLKLAVSKKDYAGALAKVDAIAENSTYKAKAAELNNKLRDQYIAETLVDAKTLSRLHKCTELSKLENKSRAVYAEAGDAVKNVGCEEQIAVTPTNKDPIKNPIKNPIKDPIKNPDKDPGKDPVKASCDVMALEVDAQTKANDGQNGAALRAYEAVMRCSGKTNYAVIAGISACKSNNADRARYWFKVSGGKVGIQQSCFQQNPKIDVTTP